MRFKQSRNNLGVWVADVALDSARISRAQNGVRIKTWQGGAGYVRGVRFANVAMDGVDHPIVMDVRFANVAGILLSDVNLRRADDDGEVQTVCNCAVGFDYGRVQPAADCLRSSTCGGAPDDQLTTTTATRRRSRGRTRPSS
jgi:polygalacturonase